MATLTRNITHAELLTAIANSTLNIGESLRITDYQTVHTIPNTTDTNTGGLEPLIVTAISANELKPEAYSLLFPDDIIYYCPDNDQSKVTGCTKGYIYRRIDTKQNNDFPFDFRQVKFRRWQIDQPAWLVGETYGKGQVVKHPSNATLWASLHDVNENNAVGSNNEHWRQFEWDNLSFVSWLPDYFPTDEVRWYLTPNANYNDYHFFADGDYATCYSNDLDAPNGNIIELSNTVVFGANFNFNSIGAIFSSNSIGDNFVSNSISAGFFSNSVGAHFISNSIGDSFSSNSIGAYFYNNNIGAYFQNSSIGANFQNNSIGASFSNNNIGASFYNNSIGANFQNNSIGASFYNNSIGAIFQSNTISDNFNNCNGTLIGVDFTSETNVSETYSCTLFTNAAGLPKLSYYDSSDVLQIITLTQM